jgi:hypothetical protein
VIGKTIYLSVAAKFEKLYQSVVEKLAGKVIVDSRDIAREERSI